MATKFAIAAFLYAFALVAVWAGVDLAPQRGWPVTDVELHGCIFLIFGMAAKVAGHFVLASIR